MKQLNEYIESTFKTNDQFLEQVVRSIEEKEMPPISVSSSAGKLLTMLVSITGAKQVLEIGALGGYSGTCMARGFGARGHLTSLELHEEYAKLAHQNLRAAGFGDQVTYYIGEALTSLEKLVSEKKQFDFFFIDADKDNYEHYLEYAIQLASPQALIVADNVLAQGTVVDAELRPKKYTEIMKNFNEIVANHPKLESLLIPIGDGMTVSRVKNKF